MCTSLISSSRRCQLLRSRSWLSYFKKCIVIHGYIESRNKGSWWEQVEFGDNEKNGSHCHQYWPFPPIQNICKLWTENHRNIQWEEAGNNHPIEEAQLHLLWRMRQLESMMLKASRALASYVIYPLFSTVQMPSFLYPTSLFLSFFLQPWMTLLGHLSITCQYWTRFFYPKSDLAVLCCSPRLTYLGPCIKHTSRQLQNNKCSRRHDGVFGKTERIVWDFLRSLAGKGDGESQVSPRPYAGRQVELGRKEKFLEKQVVDSHQVLSRAWMKHCGERRWGRGVGANELLMRRGRELGCCQCGMDEIRQVSRKSYIIIFK